jgi:hypothetical protein
MRPYERIPLDDEPEVPNATPAVTAAPSSSSSTAVPRDNSNPPPFRPIPMHARGNDGVFANLSAKPEAPAISGKQFQEIEPPSYADIVHENPPAFFETTTVIAMGEDGDVLIEGLPVGNFFTFIVNMLVSMSFDFIGFFLTTILATSHAARCGSRSGLGITLIRYGFFIQQKTIEGANDGDFDRMYPDDPNAEEEIVVQNEWISYILIIVGFFIMLRANADFVRVRRMRAIVLAPPSESLPPV